MQRNEQRERDAEREPSLCAVRECRDQIPEDEALCARCQDEGWRIDPENGEAVGPGETPRPDAGVALCRLLSDGSRSHDFSTGDVCSRCGAARGR